MAAENYSNDPVEGDAEPHAKENYTETVNSSVNIINSNSGAAVSNLEPVEGKGLLHCNNLKDLVNDKIPITMDDDDNNSEAQTNQSFRELNLESNDVYYLQEKVKVTKRMAKELRKYVHNLNDCKIIIHHSTTIKPNSKDFAVTSDNHFVI